MSFSNTSAEHAPPSAAAQILQEDRDRRSEETLRSLNEKLNELTTAVAQKNRVSTRAREAPMRSRRRSAATAAAAAPARETPKTCGRCGGFYYKGM